MHWNVSKCFDKSTPGEGATQQTPPKSDFVGYQGNSPEDTLYVLSLGNGWRLALQCHYGSSSRNSIAMAGYLPPFH